MFEKLNKRPEHDEENSYRIAISSSVNCDSRFRGSSQLYLTRSTVTASTTTEDHGAGGSLTRRGSGRGSSDPRPELVGEVTGPDASDVAEHS